MIAEPPALPHVFSVYAYHIQCIPTLSILLYLTASTNVTSLSLSLPSLHSEPARKE